MKTLYLHIGTPKTATTAIQSFCFDNQDVLEKHGYYYPMFDYRFDNVQKYRNGHFLVCRILDENRKRIPEKQEAFTLEAIGKLLELFEEHDTIILSDEGIWNRGFFEDTHCWSKIQKELVNRGILVKVIVYFRRQDDFLFSWWNQQVKEGMLGSSVMTWEEVTEQLPYIKLDYYDVLEHISEYVGKENIIVRIFDRKHFVGGTIQEDFLNAIGLELTQEYKVLESVQNVSLTKNNIEIKRALNMIPELNGKENSYFRKLLTQMSEEVTDDRSINMFSVDEDQAFMKQYCEGNDRIAKEYMGTDSPMFEDAGAGKEKWSTDNEEMIQDVVRFFGTTTIYLMRENQELKKHINNIRFKMKHPVKAMINKLKKKE